MRFRLRPVEGTFYDLFNESASHLVKGANLLAETLHEDSDLKELAKRSRDAEHDADETTHEIVKLVNQSFVTPFDREDVYRLASLLDDVMDFIDETVDMILLYKVKEIPTEFADLVETLQTATQVTADGMPRLRSMRNLEEYWIEINRLENDGDRQYRRIVADLFSGKYKAIEVLKLKDIVDSVESAIDALESVANTVEQIAVKDS